VDWLDELELMDSQPGSTSDIGGSHDRGVGATCKSIETPHGMTDHSADVA